MACTATTDHTPSGTWSSPIMPSPAQKCPSPPQTHFLSISLPPPMAIQHKLCLAETEMGPGSGRLVPVLDWPVPTLWHICNGGACPYLWQPAQGSLHWHKSKFGSGCPLKPNITRTTNLISLTFVVDFSLSYKHIGVVFIPNDMRGKNAVTSIVHKMNRTNLNML